MATVNPIKPRRTFTAAKVPSTTDIQDGEFAINATDKKTFIRSGSSIVQVGAGSVSGLDDVAVSSPADGQVLTYDAATSKFKNADSAAGVTTGKAIAMAIVFGG